ncbi:MAG: RimK/LysX family protein [Myxococcota bacterium]|nr:RimK/LysX family protein [Myxococcota bacterium]
MQRGLLFYGAAILAVLPLLFSCAQLRGSEGEDGSEDGALQSNDCPPDLYKDKLLVVGGVERVQVEPQGVVLEARVDTGARTSSIDAQDIVPFERDGKPWVKFKLPLRDDKKSSVEITTPVTGRASIKRHGEAPLHRLVVSLRVVLGPIDRVSDFTLADRAGYDFPVLIGRSYLQGLALVDVDREKTMTPRPEASGE